jgi:signal transduction histidine kinase/ligand-binding sensor domain-containing protein
VTGVAGRRGLRFLAVLTASGLASVASAMDPDRALSQYVRERWGSDRGFPGGTVQAISQTADGYLWVGTDRGVFRFDGQTFRPYRDPRPAGVAIPRVLGLSADGRGNLWMRLGGPRLLRYHDGTVDPTAPLLRFHGGQLESVPALEPTEDAITAMGSGRGGGVLVAGIINGVLRWSGTRFEPVAPGLERLGASAVVSIAEAADGAIWMGTQEDGVLRLAEGRITRYKAGLNGRKVNAVLPVGARDVWIATDEGVVRWDGREISARGLDPRLFGAAATSLLADRESNVWIATGRGLMRVTTDGASTLEPAAPSRGPVTALFEDHDGSLWIGGAGELERLREVPFTAFGTAQGLPSDLTGAVAVDADRRVWFAPLGGGVFSITNGRVAEVRAEGLPGDVAYSLAARGRELWVGRKSGALTRISGGGASLRTYRARDGLVPRPIYAVHVSADGTVWAGSLGGGLSRLADDRFTTYTTKDGLASDTITSIADRADGSTWVGTPSGLGAFSDGGWRVYTTRDGLPSDEVNCVLEDSAHTLWIGTADGLAFVGDGGAQLASGSAPALREQVFGMAEDRSGWLWVATAKGVVRARRDALASGAVAEGDVVAYGAAEGLSATAAAKRHRSVAADPTGRIWFSTDRGLFVVDPARAAEAAAPVVSRIESLSADGTSIELAEPTRVPPGARRVTFAYSGVSLSAPDAIRFRYRLDGFDADWSDPVPTRAAVYTNLGPGAYRFRVMASNREGVWRGAEAALGLQIQPTIWQTGAFRAGAGLAGVVVLGFLYRLRVRRLAREITVRFEERLDERTRIAQELHDTLLQGFLSASMQLHLAVDEVPAPSPARRRLDDVLALMARVIEEGRNAVRGLRSADDGFDLEQALARVRDDVRADDEVEFRVIREGQPRPLHPMIRDDVYRIGREAVVNAIRHAHAARIELEVEYAPHQLRLLVRDDGRGIDAEVLRAGRDGHWGLSGMRERAERVGGHLRVWSRPGAGAEIELSVPGHVAFPSSGPPGLRARLAAITRRWWRRIPRSGDSSSEKPR